MSDMNQRTACQEATGVAVLVILTFFLQAAFLMPRMMCTMTAMKLLWNPASSPSPLQQILYVLFDFLFALLVGAMAIGSRRQFVPGLREPVIILRAAIVILIYAVFTLLLRGRPPAYFFPTYLDLSAGIPGWFIGYYLAGGFETRASFDRARLVSIAAPATVIIIAVVAAPSVMPFYTAAPRQVVVNTFQPVLPQSTGASFTPPPPPQQFNPPFQSIPYDQSQNVFRLHTDSSNGQ